MKKRIEKIKREFIIIKKRIEKIKRESLNSRIIL